MNGLVVAEALDRSAHRIVQAFQDLPEDPDPPPAVVAGTIMPGDRYLLVYGEGQLE